MATATGTQVGHWYTKIVYTVSLDSDTKATVTCKTYWCSDSYGFAVTGCTGYAKVGSSTTTNSSFKADSDYGESVSILVATESVTYTRTTSAQSVTCKGSCTMTGWSQENGTSTATGTISVAAIPVYTPSAPSSFSAARSSDTKNVLSWTNNTSTTKPYTSIEVRRSVNGGSYSTIATLSGSATSYNDASTSANNYYRYAIRAVNSAGNSSYAYSGYLYNTPCAPTSITAARSSDTDVAITLVNSSNTASGLELQRSEDGATWSTIATYGTFTTSATDTPGGGTFYYRARNTYGSLTSAWSATSNAVVTIVAPAAPTLISPVSGSVVSLSSEEITFSWKHNPIDGSAQTQAKITAYLASDPDRVVQYQVSGSDNFYTVENDFNVNETVTWQVATRGVSEDWSDYSAASVFSVSQVPTVVVTTPSEDGATVDDVPLLIEWSYSDVSGTQRSAVIDIANSNGISVYSTNVTGSSTSASISAVDFLPTNNSEYTITVVVVSTSSLIASALRSFAIAYDPPAPPFLMLEEDEQNASVALTIFEGDTTEDDAATASLGLFREREDGTLLPLLDQVQEGAGVVDVYPPLDTELKYIAVAYTDNGLSAQQECTLTLSSGGGVLCNFGDGLTEVASIVMNAEISADVIPTVTLFEAAGSSEPMVFYGAAKTATTVATGSVWRIPPLDGSTDTAQTREQWELAQAHVGTTVVRYPGGRVEAAYSTIGIRESALNAMVATVTLTTRKVRADGLVL